MLKIAMDHLESLECITKAITETERKENHQQKRFQLMEQLIGKMKKEGADQLDTMASMRRIINKQIEYLQIIADRFTS